jgi:hypothetical protein
MPSPNQAEGARWEETVARFLREQGFTGAERIRVKHPDRGDIGGLTDWVIECKNTNPKDGRFTLSEAMDQAASARVTAGAPYAMVVKNRARANVARAFCVVELGLMVPLMRRLDEEGS